MKSGFDRFLRVVNQIKDDSKAVLEIVAAALDAGSARMTPPWPGSGLR